MKSVKERELPALDDDFAQTASEFDTLDELRADVRTRVEGMKGVQQGVQARDRVLEALLAKVEIPLPEGVIKAEIDSRNHSLAHQLEAANMTKADFLAAEGQSEEEFDADIEQSTRGAMTAQFVLDKVVEKEQLSVNEAELTQHILRTRRATAWAGPVRPAGRAGRPGPGPRQRGRARQGAGPGAGAGQGRGRVRPAGRPRGAARGRPGRPAADDDRADDGIDHTGHDHD